MPNAVWKRSALQRGHSHEQAAPGTPGAANGTFKNYFDRGTTSGTFSLTITASSPMNLKYTGNVTYAGGGTIACTTTDGGAHKSCEVNTTLTD